MIDLSVLICSTHTRWRTFGQAIQEQIWQQYNGLAPGFQSAIEILMLTDNKAMMLGAKRNAMVDIAQGRYVVFIDDDDRIADNYLVSILDAIARHPADVITFQVSVSLNGEAPMPCYYSKDFPVDRNRADRYERLPNHLMPVRRDLAKRVSFPHIAYGEDSGYSKLLKPLLETEHAIDRVLYHYDYNDMTTEAQEHKRNASRRRSGPPIVDIVMLSKADTPALRRMTQVAVRSAVNGANGLPVNVMVLEQAPTIRYRFAHTHRMSGDFNYNRFANIGARMGSAEWIMIANNDLVFHDGWLHKLLAADHPLVSPKCPRDERQAGITENTVGTRNAVHLSGWCFMIRRELWEKIGGFDECCNFWFSDDIVIEQAKAVGVQPMMVPAATVEHLRSATIASTPNRDDLMWRQLDIYAAKYGPHPFSRDPRYRHWKRRNA